jgi:hypothetical protein
MRVIKVEVSYHCDIYRSTDKSCVRKSGERNVTGAVKGKKRIANVELCLFPRCKQFCEFQYLSWSKGGKVFFQGGEAP